MPKSVFYNFVWNQILKETVGSLEKWSYAFWKHTPTELLIKCQEISSLSWQGRIISYSYLLGTKNITVEFYNHSSILLILLNSDAGQNYRKVNETELK